MNIQKASKVLLRNFQSLGKYCQISLGRYFFLPQPVDTPTNVSIQRNICPSTKFHMITRKLPGTITGTV